MTTPLTVTRDTVKRLSVYKQGLHQRPASNTQDDLKHIIKRIGLLQLDSISVVARSHYLVMLSRAGLYNRDDLDQLLNDGWLFEGWVHCACQLPSADYPFYHAYLQRRHAKNVTWYADKLGEHADDIIHEVMQTIRENGAMSSKDFDSARKEAGGWWNWKPAKIALEHLYRNGDLLVSHREKFQRYYDLAERVLAPHNFKLDKTVSDFEYWAVERGLYHTGIGTLEHISDYYRQGKLVAKPILETMVKSGDAHPVEVVGWQEEAYIHTDDLPLLEQIQAGEHAPQLTVFLSPFDSLFWNRDRDETLWDFYYRIEVYTPKAKRQYGYYVMPILHGQELVGRIDPKVDRKKKKLTFHALYLEDTTEVTQALIDGLITAIEEFMAFHNCTSFELSACENAMLKQSLQKHFA